MYQMYISISVISVPPDKVNLPFRLSRFLSFIKDKVLVPWQQITQITYWLFQIYRLVGMMGEGRGSWGGGGGGGLAARRTHCQKQGKQGRYLQNIHVTPPPPPWRHTSSLSYTQYTYTLCTVSRSLCHHHRHHHHHLPSRSDQPATPSTPPPPTPTTTHSLTRWVAG